MKKILLLTAGFGEGHNTAARNISEALQSHPDVETRIVDVYAITLPRFTKILQSGYGLAINKFPVIWGVIFNLLDRRGGLEKTLFLAGTLRKAVGQVVGEFRPDVIISTYPLYAFLIRQLRERSHAACRAPLVTMITDSTAINTSWYRAGSEVFLLADQETADSLRQGGANPECLQILGFPVAPRFASLPPLAATAEPPWRILYLPSSKSTYTLAVLAALRLLPQVEVTVVTGRLKALHKTLAESGLVDGKQVTLIGWTDQIPELLSSHHLFLGKAGGAIVHEAMAAQCPILVSHVVPGQEEGNIELIERHDIGRLAAHFPSTLASSVAEIFADNAATWRRWKRHLEKLSRPAAAHEIAQFILKITD